MVLGTESQFPLSKSRLAASVACGLRFIYPPRVLISLSFSGSPGGWHRTVWSLCEDTTSEISPCVTSNRDSPRWSRKVQMFHVFRVLSNSPQLARIRAFSQLQCGLILLSLTLHKPFPNCHRPPLKVSQHDLPCSQLKSSLGSMPLGWHCLFPQERNRKK